MQEQVGATEVIFCPSTCQAQDHYWSGSKEHEEMEPGRADAVFDTVPTKSRNIYQRCKSPRRRWEWGRKKDEPLSMADVAEMPLSMDRTTIPSPASSVQSARSTVGGHRKRSRGSSSSTSTANLESALSKFIASRPLPVEPQVPEKKRELMNFFEDVAELMMLFSDVDIAEIKNLRTRVGVQPEHSRLCGNARDTTQWGHKLIIWVLEYDEFIM